MHMSRGIYILEGSWVEVLSDFIINQSYFRDVTLNLYNKHLFVINLPFIKNFGLR